MGESEPLFESEEPVKTGEEEVVERSSGSILWVEKYSPKNYTELLSDDVSHLVLVCTKKDWLEERKGGGEGRERERLEEWRKERKRREGRKREEEEGRKGGKEERGLGGRRVGGRERLGGRLVKFLRPVGV